MPKIFTNIAAAILSGGKASRLGGIAKGNLVVHNNKTIIQHLLDEIKISDIHDTIIVANEVAAYENYNVPIVADLWRDIGPLAGIASAVDYYIKKQPQYTAILILPCDLPNITSTEISKLVKAFYFYQKPIVFAATAENKLHPLCAVINCNILPQLKYAITKKHYKIRYIWHILGAATVIFQHKKNFHNINSDEDF